MLAHLGLCANILPRWSECQTTVLAVMLVEMVVYTEHISKQSGELSLQGIFRGTLMGSLMSGKETLSVTCSLLVMFNDFLGRVYQG